MANDGVSTLPLPLLCPEMRTRSWVENCCGPNAYFLGHFPIPSVDLSTPVMRPPLTRRNASLTEGFSSVSYLTPPDKPMPKEPKQREVESQYILSSFSKDDGPYAMGAGEPGNFYSSQGNEFELITAYPVSTTRELEMPPEALSRLMAICYDHRMDLRSELNNLSELQRLALESPATIFEPLVLDHPKSLDELLRELKLFKENTLAAAKLLIEQFTRQSIESQRQATARREMREEKFVADTIATLKTIISSGSELEQVQFQAMQKLNQRHPRTEEFQDRQNSTGNHMLGNSYGSEY